MDGIYSNVIDVNGSGCYSVQVTVKGTNNITWNMENLHPSGVVPSECGEYIPTPPLPRLNDLGVGIKVSDVN